MALINLPNGRWIDIPAPKYGIDYGVESNKVIENNITPERVIEILRGIDDELDDSIIYNNKEWGGGNNDNGNTPKQLEHGPPMWGAVQA
ncbi:MAG: hypothetical protein ABIF11_02445 [Nitrospirota bacterium]